MHCSILIYPPAFSTLLTLRASRVCGEAAPFRAWPGPRNKEGHATLQLHATFTFDPEGQGLIVCRRISSCMQHRLSTSAPAEDDFRQQGTPDPPAYSTPFATFSLSKQWSIFNFPLNWLINSSKQQKLVSKESVKQPCQCCSDK